MDLIVNWPFTHPGMCERGSSSFSAMSRLKLVRTTSASFLSMPCTDSTNREKCLCCELQCLPCLSLFYSSHWSRRFPLVTSCICLRLIIQIWHWLWRQYGFPISYGWGRCLWYLIKSHPDVLPPLICCGPCGLGVFRGRSYRGRIVKRGRGACNVIHCGMQWWILCVCI